VLLTLRRLDEALASFDQAISLKPDYSEAFWNKSIALLLKGDLDAGWPLYEWRWQPKEISLFAGKRNFSQPLWLGKEVLIGKTILLWAEQGLGDTIQFCRFARLVSDLGAKVVLEVPKPLVNLLNTLEGVDHIVATGSALPEFDYQCPLMSLPLALKINLSVVSSQVPYLQAQDIRKIKWQHHIKNEGFKIAICWQGNSTTTLDIGRSFPVILFEEIAKINGVRLISLQKNSGLEQLRALPKDFTIEVLPEEFDSGENAFLDSIAVMTCVDLVITSDTSLAHVAGALGVKTWLPLKYVPDWRWLLDRDDSPWYPSLKLYRQKAIGDWSSVFKDIENDLKSVIAAKVAEG
jgi:hypothetical protein